MKKASAIVGIILGVLALLAIVLLVAGGLWMGARGGFSPHMMRGWSGVAWGMHPFGGGLIGLVLLGLIAGAVALLVWGLGHRAERAGPAGAAPAESEPLQILKRRYAAGEIDREEYERMREDLLK